MEEEIVLIEENDIEEINIDEENYSGKPYELPIASKDTLGGIKIGKNLNINPDGTLDAQAGFGDDVEFAEKQNNMITASLPAHVEIEKTNVAQKITSFVELTKIGDKFSVENGVIKIGKGVSKVKVAYNAVAQATASTTRVFTYIMLNDSAKSQESYYFSDKIYQVGNAIPSMLFDVQEGDEITLQIYGPAGNKILGAETFTYWTQITVEEYHDNNLVIAKGVVENLGEYAKTTDIPTNVSQLNNDENYINKIKTINGQSLEGEGNIVIEGGSGGTYEKVEKIDMLQISPSSSLTINVGSAWSRHIVPFDIEKAKIGTNLSITSDGGIKIGEGISKIKIDGHLFGRASTTCTLDAQLRITRNGTTLGFVGFYYPITSAYQSFILINPIVDVQEGDIIHMVLSSNVSNVTYTLSTDGFLVVQKILDTNVLTDGVTEEYVNNAINEAIGNALEGEY